MLRVLREGLNEVVPVDLFSLFSSNELERLFCGMKSVDIDLLKQCVEYDDDLSPSSPHILFFWEVLEEMEEEEKRAFLRFVWARSTLPPSISDLSTNFRIQSPIGEARYTPDLYLPIAQTCFFSLSLPKYSSKEILRSKLLYAIFHSPNMDADIRLHDGEGWE